VSLEKKKKEVELMKIRAARTELEFKIMERESEIEKMRNHMKLHDKREVELLKELKGDR
jgi:hypothetical protein